jgi:hypothetical protein
LLAEQGTGIPVLLTTFSRVTGHSSILPSRREHTPLSAIGRL